MSRAVLRSEVADLIAQVARAEGGVGGALVLDITGQAAWLAASLRRRGVRVMRTSNRAGQPPVAVADTVGLARLAAAGESGGGESSPVSRCSLLVLVEVPGPTASEPGDRVAGAYLVDFVPGRFELTDTVTCTAPPSRRRGYFDGPSRSQDRGAVEQLAVQFWAAPGHQGASLESLLISTSRPGGPERVIVSRASRAVAPTRPDTPAPRADLAVSDLLYEVEMLREELDRGMYRAARKGRDLVACVPYGLPAAKVALRATIRARQMVRSRWPSVAAPPRVPLDPRGTSYPARERWLDLAAPEVSIVILNWNRGTLTMAALQHVWHNTTGSPYEVLVVDNGSAPGDLRLAHQERSFYREVRIGVNRYFGEGNNIGAEEARGRWLIFLNNDALPQPGWLEPLLAAMSDPQVGAVGSRLLFPDGRIQETGALIQPDGTPIQLEKGMPFEQGTMEPLRQVDYCSAAALCIRREDFIELGGFDLTWEPAYYEDVDLCMKVRQSGKRVVCATQSHVVHLEHATTASTAGALDLRGQPEFNRPKFVERWGALLSGSGSAERSGSWPAAEPKRKAVAAPAAYGERQFKVGVYTPYQLVPGGGERYLLVLARVLAGSGSCTLLFPDRYSRLRIGQLARELGVPISDHLVTEVWDRRRRDFDFDYFVALGNEVTPLMEGVGRTNIYVCQFPFPAPARVLRSRVPADRTYHQVFVYSEFSARAYTAARLQLGLPARWPTVVNPPCGSASSALRELPQDVVRIVSVGRFFRGGHEKRHDVMIRALRELIRRGTDACSLELHLVGTAMQQWGSRAYLRQLERLAAGLPVFFHVNAPGQVVSELLEKSHVYLHCAGFEVDQARHPERLEHFGISIVEAMARGCVPLAYDAGGPREIIRDGVDGVLYHNFEELVRASTSLIGQAAAGAPEFEALRVQASVRARDFTDQRFVERVVGVVNGSGPT